MAEAHMVVDNSCIIMDNSGIFTPPTKISVTGLPKTLVVSLNSILEENSVCSWNIRCNNNSTQVWIRFSGETNSDQMDKTDVSYRKVPPSKVLRDRDRAQQWCEKDTHHSASQVVDNSNSIIEEVLDHNPVSPSNTTPVSTMNQPAASDQSLEINSSQYSEPSDSRSSIAQRTRSRSQQHSESDSQQHKQYYSSKQNKSFKKLNYKGKRMNPMCRICFARYKDIRESTYMCTYCPDGAAPICLKCGDSGRHKDHRGGLVGPYILQQLAE